MSKPIYLDFISFLGYHRKMDPKLTFLMTLDVLDDDIATGRLIESDHRLMRHLIKVCGQKRFTFTPERILAKTLKVNGKPISHSKVTKGISRLRRAGHISTRKTNGNNRIELKTYIENKSRYSIRGKEIQVR
tara:strand:+ start:13723 stop:14118 length:396 start_codon:yes stop_codon:yes gene_type:complete